HFGDSPSVHARWPPESAGQQQTSGLLVSVDVPCLQNLVEEKDVYAYRQYRGYAFLCHCIIRDSVIAMVMGSFVYVYGASVVLALIGVALGSALYGRVPRGTDEHQRWVAVLGLLIVFTAALSMLVLPRIPFLFTQFFSLLRESFRWQIAAHFASTAMVAFLPPLLFGAMFPAAIGSFGGGAARFGETVGAACVANGIGMAAGFWVAGFVLIPTVGLYDTMNAGVLAAVGAGLAVWWRIRARKPPRLLALAPAAAVLVIVIL